MSLPLCIASKFLNIKIFLFEPNGVLGKSNRFILSISKKIICYDGNIKLFPKKLRFPFRYLTCYLNSILFLFNFTFLNIYIRQ